MESNYNFYYSVVLTVGPDKKDIKGKSEEYILGKLLDWANRIKNINEILNKGPYLDRGEKGNLHVNMTLCSNNINNVEEIRKTYFMSWIRTKGFVEISHTRDLVKWNEYAERNHYDLLVKNIMNK